MRYSHTASRETAYMPMYRRVMNIRFRPTTTTNILHTLHTYTRAKVFLRRRRGQRQYAARRGRRDSCAQRHLRNVSRSKTNLLKIFRYFRAIESNQRSPGREEKRLLSPRTPLTTRDLIREAPLIQPRVGASGARRTHPDLPPIPSALA